MDNEQMRQAFEAWGNEQNTSGNPDRLQRKGDGYVYTTADIMWEAWQAALATRPTNARDDALEEAAAHLENQPPHVGGYGSAAIAIRALKGGV